MKTLTEQFTEILTSNKWEAWKLKELINVVKEQYEYVIGEDSHNIHLTFGKKQTQDNRNKLRKEQRKRAEETL